MSVLVKREREEERPGSPIPWEEEDGRRKKSKHEEVVSTFSVLLPYRYLGSSNERRFLALMSERSCCKVGFSEVCTVDGVKLALLLICQGTVIEEGTREEYEKQSFYDIYTLVRRYFPVGREEQLENKKHVQNFKEQMLCKRLEDIKISVPPAHVQ